ncbi:MAG: hypothetical protein RR420_05485 [Anaerovoracaceae bacterium]
MENLIISVGQIATPILAISTITGWILKVWIMKPMEKDIKNIMDNVKRIEQNLQTNEIVNSEHSKNIIRLEMRCDILENEVHDLKQKA